MGYFPFFIDLSGRNGLIIGGGAVALRKVQKLLPFGARLTVCAPAFLPEFADIPGLVLLHRPFEPAMLDNMFFVVAATSDPALNRQISALCQQKNILVNAADDRRACTFLFPALVKQGELSIGISTGGASPSAAVYLKERISALLPDGFDGLLAYLDSLRPWVKAELPHEQSRAVFFSKLFDACIETGWPVSETRLREMLLDVSEGRKEAT